MTTGIGKRLYPWCKRLVVTGLTLIPASFTLLAACQSRILYFPRPYGAEITTAWSRKTSGKTIQFLTNQGPQRAFLQGNLTSARNLWIVCGGNGSLALDWSDWLLKYAPAQDAYLLVDFPGYGDCQGTPSPGSIRESFSAAVPAATAALGWSQPPDPARLRIFGHSLGAAAALIAASELGIQRGVLLTPFTSTMEMSRAITGLPLGFLIWHRFDNSARLAEIAARGPAKISIFHGTDDEIIPVSMSHKLAGTHPRTITLQEIPQGLHNSLQETHAPEIAAAMSDIGNKP